MQTQTSRVNVPFVYVQVKHQIPKEHFAMEPLKDFVPSDTEFPAYLQLQWN